MSARLAGSADGAATWISAMSVSFGSTGLPSTQENGTMVMDSPAIVHTGERDEH